MRFVMFYRVLYLTVFPIKLIITSTVVLFQIRFLISIQEAFSVTTEYDSQDGAEIVVAKIIALIE